MKSEALDRQAADLHGVVEDILKQFQSVNAAAATGPEVDLHCQELRVLEFLGNEGPHMMREIANYLNVAVNSVTSIADNLEQKGLACRQRSDSDRRVIRIELTEAGRLVYQSQADMKRRLFRGMLSALNEDEQAIFMVLFRKIARAGRMQVQQMAAND